MRRKIKSIFLFILFSACAIAQDKSVDQLVITRVADYILENGSLALKDVNTGKLYTSTDNVSQDVKLTAANHYTGWHYTNGVLNMAFVNLSNFFDDKKYSDYAINQIGFGLANYKYFQKQYKPEYGPYYMFPFAQLWAMRELDDCGAMAASMIDVFNVVKKDSYKEYIEKTANHILEKQERLDDGTLVRSGPHKMTLWGDDLYMSVPFLARMGKFSGDQKYWDDAAKQIKNFTKYLWDENKELYYHCYYTDIERNGVAHWGRCNGWIIMAKVHLLNILPEDYPGRDELIENLEIQILGLAKYQSKEGLWHQLLDKNDSYLETSCSAMFIYSIARAVNQGWIDKRYASIALRGWEGLKENKIELDGQVKDICVGTGLEDNLVFYYTRPARKNEMHGLGAVIDAGIEIIKLKETL